MTSMSDMDVRAGGPAMAEATIDRFAADLDGLLARPGTDPYVAATTIWNGMIRKRPSAVVRAASVEDVARTVRRAAEHDVELSIRAGGHNIAGLSLSDGGITLDLSGFRDVVVDPDARIARVGAGSLLGDLDRATQAHGLAAPLGFVSATGVAGLTLGGGFGYLTRRFGWTVDRLEEVEIVMADGTVRRASRTEEPELFWAIRGGGGNFGVVTEFVFRLDEVGPQITGGVIAWPAAAAAEVLDVFRATTESAPRELTMAAVRRNAPPAPWLPAEAHGTPVVMVVVCHSGPPEQAESDLAALRGVARPLADLVMPKEYTAQQTLLDATQPTGMQYYWKSEFVPGLSDGLLETYHAQFDGLTAPANQIVLFHLAGALNEHPEDDGAVGNREAGFACVIQSMTAPDVPSDANRAWVRDAWQALRPFSTGGNYVNFQTDDEPDARTAASYGSNFDRLRAAKQRYDPSNLFRVNRNIR
ncbi:MAG TPA: FAD-binding oxidoreductase [Candidatus Angelobacter sp.]|nr:FAD-binding oxidoreductase [Candidatus Angelobacter sp.]